MRELEDRKNTCPQRPNSGILVTPEKLSFNPHIRGGTAAEDERPHALVPQDVRRPQPQVPHRGAQQTAGNRPVDPENDGRINNQHHK